MSAPDLALLDSVLDSIERGEAAWYQGAWAIPAAETAAMLADPDVELEPSNLGPGACGTAFCVAGHVLLRAGWAFDADSGLFCKGGEAIGGDLVGAQAQVVLGISHGQGLALWQFDNSLARLRQVRDQIASDAEIDGPVAW